MAANNKRQPAIFLPHGGGPCFFMDWTWGPADTWHRTQRFLAGLAATLPETPRAIVVVSGHWEEPAFTASAAAEPKLIFDYSGFPEHTYKLTWPAPGEPELAARVAELLSGAGLPSALSQNRGFDHGVFVPLKVAFPEAQIPVVTLSLAASLDPALHLAAGRALAPLRDKGVLIVGSGMSFHNLRGYSNPETPAKSEGLRCVADEGSGVSGIGARSIAGRLAECAVCQLRTSPGRTSDSANGRGGGGWGGAGQAHLWR